MEVKGGVVTTVVTFNASLLPVANSLALGAGLADEVENADAGVIMCLTLWEHTNQRNESRLHTNASVRVYLHTP